MPQIRVRSKIVDPASNPTPVTTHSCAVSSLLSSPDAEEGKKRVGILKFE